jgi:very-short-patch-repair endonuclease
MKLMNRQTQKERRKELRSNATTSEKRLWKFLNKKQQDFKFRVKNNINVVIRRILFECGVE